MVDSQHKPLLPRRSVLIAPFAAVSCAFRSAAPQGRPFLWQDPGAVENFDFTNGPHGPDFAPKPPFRFVIEDLRGTSPKVFVTDAAGRTWRVKGGLEVRSEAFCTRLASAVGYYGEPTYFIPSGRIAGIAALKRASGFIQNDGSFTYASFARFEPGSRFLDDGSWTWSRNPFNGTPQLNGLKILVMLVSDWDNKDATNTIRGSNVGILERKNAAGADWIYFVDDWGQSLGRWGASYNETSTFDCGSFLSKTGQFVTSASEAGIQFGYRGQHQRDFSDSIHRSDAAWLMRFLGRVTDNQLRAGLRASGAAPDEVACFVTALRARIDQLAQTSTLAA